MHLSETQPMNVQSTNEHSINEQSTDLLPTNVNQLHNNIANQLIHWLLFRYTYLILNFIVVTCIIIYTILYTKFKIADITHLTICYLIQCVFNFFNLKYYINYFVNCLSANKFLAIDVSTDQGIMFINLIFMIFLKDELKTLSFIIFIFIAIQMIMLVCHQIKIQLNQQN